MKCLSSCNRSSFFLLHYPTRYTWSLNTVDISTEPNERPNDHPYLTPTKPAVNQFRFPVRFPFDDFCFFRISFISWGGNGRVWGLWGGCRRVTPTPTHHTWLFLRSWQQRSWLSFTWVVSYLLSIYLSSTLKALSIETQIITVNRYFFSWLLWFWGEEYINYLTHSMCWGWERREGFVSAILISPQKLSRLGIGSAVRVRPIPGACLYNCHTETRGRGKTNWGHRGIPRPRPTPRPCKRLIGEVVQSR